MKRECNDEKNCREGGYISHVLTSQAKFLCEEGMEGRGRIAGAAVCCASFDFLLSTAKLEGCGLPRMVSRAGSEDSQIRHTASCDHASLGSTIGR